MRVVYISQDYTPHDYRFLERLAQSPHEVWYLRFETCPTSLETRPVPSGIKVVEWMGNTTCELRGWGKLKLFLEFRKVIQKLRPDLVHAGPVQTCGFFTAIAGFKPLLLMSWGSDILAEADKSFIRRWITRFTIRHARMIVCDCLAVRDKIIKLAGYPANRIIVFPWGVDLNQFRPAPSHLRLREKLGWQDKRVVITTRSLEPVYGIEVFLEAAREVIERVPESRILMLGNGSLESEVKAFVAQHKLGHAIYLAGRVPHNMLPDYFNEADLYASSSYSDGTSVSLLEAMACKLPVVVTDLPSNREWVTPGVNGWLVPPGNPEALSAAMVEALEDGGRGKGMGEANMLVAKERADWERNSSKLLAVYQKLIRSEE